MVREERSVVASVLVARFGEKKLSGVVCCPERSHLFFGWLALARSQFTGHVCWWELSLSLLVAPFGEKAVHGPCVLLAA